MTVVRPEGTHYIMNTVLAHGTFDILHPGHTRYLEFAKSQGDYLIVAVSSDAMARLRKGHDRPVNDFDHRSEVVRALRSVDKVVQAPMPTHRLASNILALVLELRPDVLVSSYADFAEQHGQALTDLGVKLVLAPRFSTQSTTSIIHSIRRLQNEKAA